MTTIELLTTLCHAPATSGREANGADTVCALLKELAPSATVTIDPLGNVLATFTGVDSTYSKLLDAHLDQIGLTVTQITDDGFLRMAPVGGVDRRILPYAQVTVLGNKPLQGVVAFLPPHLTEQEDTYPKAEELCIDVGLPKEEVEAIVELGSPILLHAPITPLLNGCVTGGALDNRAGCAALLRCAKELENIELPCNITLLFSTREEVGCEGAKTGAYLAHANEAVVVDVTFADQPGVEPHQCGKLGAGPMIGIAATLSHAFGQRLIALCQEQEIPYQLEVMGGRTGTNADTIAVSGHGVPSVTLSIPLRYMHTTAELVSLCDIEQTAKLLTAYCKGGV